MLELSAREVTLTCPQLTLRMSYTPPVGHGELPRGRWVSVARSLDGIPSHKDAGAGLVRFAFVDAPVRCALHQVLDTARIVPLYCWPHAHEDAAELNVLLPGGPTPLAYSMSLSDAPVATHHAPEVLWIPARTMHSAVATSGTGFFVMLQVPALAGAAPPP